MTIGFILEFYGCYLERIELWVEVTKHNEQTAEKNFLNCEQVLKINTALRMRHFYHLVVRYFRFSLSRICNVRPHLLKYIE